MEKTDIETFLKLAKLHPVLDVRSPGEYLHAHIPGAASLPLFDDEQRSIIGTAYKQKGRGVAVDYGLNFFSERMKKMHGEILNLVVPAQKKEAAPSTFLVHCWRGGMRSEAVAWLLSLYGYKVYVLKGGYKEYRKWVLAQFEKKYLFKILGGYTGSGKTEILHEMSKRGNTIIDLEALANHKGSAFGSLGQNPQPSLQMFENLLAMELWQATNKLPDGEGLTTAQREIWLEDESRHMGAAGIPAPIWEQMRAAPLYFLEIPLEERLIFIVSHYGGFNKKLLVNAIMSIQKRLGGLETKNAINFLLEGDVKSCFRILILYYDKHYGNALNNRKNLSSLLNKVACKSVDIENAQLFCKPVSS